MIEFRNGDPADDNDNGLDDVQLSCAGGGLAPMPAPIPSPSGFDQTRSYPAPGRGRVKPFTSPVIPLGAPVLGIQLAFTGPLGQAVPSVPPVATVPEGLDFTEEELQQIVDEINRRRAIKRAVDICYVFGGFEITYEELVQEIEDLRRTEDFRSPGDPPLDPTAVELEDFLTDERSRFGRCIDAVRTLLGVPRFRAPKPMPGSARAQAAGAGCGVLRFSVILRNRRGSRRPTLALGSRRQARSRLKVGCAKTADGALAVTVRTRKRSARLRDVVGRRLRIGVGRPKSGPRAQAGDGLNVAWSLPAG